MESTKATNELIYIKEAENKLMGVMQGRGKLEGWD